VVSFFDEVPVRTLARISLFMVAPFAFAALSSVPARGDAPTKEPALVQIPSEDGAMPAEDNSHPSVEPRVVHPPWSGQGAIWGGVGLVIAGAAALIIAVPVTCVATAAETPCFATLGGSLGALGLGGVLLVIGELQRASYKDWLRTHPVFSGLSVKSLAGGGSGAWSVSF